MAHPTRIFKTPEELLKVWNEYKEDLKDRAREWPKIQYVGKDGERMVDYPVLPLTLEGLKRYCWENKIGDINEYFLNRHGYYNDFTIICRAIKDEIREHQITGGMNGFFNPSITQRLNNLKEQTDVTSNSEKIESISVTIVKPSEDGNNE
jgi:hypothetical protein